MRFITEKNVQVNLKEVCPKFFMKFDRIVSKLMTNQRQVGMWYNYNSNIKQ